MTKITFLVKNYAENRYYKGIYLNFFISYNCSIVSGGHFEILQKKHESGFKTLKEDLKWVPVKNQLKKRYYKGIYGNSSYVTIFEWPLAAILDFRDKNRGNFGTFYRSLRMIIWTTPEIFSFILFFPSLPLKMPKIPGLYEKIKNLVDIKKEANTDIFSAKSGWS